MYHNPSFCGVILTFFRSIFVKKLKTRIKNILAIGEILIYALLNMFQDIDGDFEVLLKTARGTNLDGKNEQTRHHHHYHLPGITVARFIY